MRYTYSQRSAHCLRRSTSVFFGILNPILRKCYAGVLRNLNAEADHDLILIYLRVREMADIEFHNLNANESYAQLMTFHDNFLGSCI